MGMEVVWIRIYTPYLGTVVYAFAAILGVYLLAMFVGAKLYRSGILRNLLSSGMTWFALGAGGLLPLIASDPKLAIPSLMRLPMGIFLVAMAAGFTTPMLVDMDAKGNPSRVGSSYAVNVVGCILGPLVAGFLLLPHMSEHWALVTLSAPWLAIGLFPSVVHFETGSESRIPWAARPAATIIVTVWAVIFQGNGFEERFPIRQVLRDSTATVIATGNDRESKQLWVNGYSMSSLTPATKMMAHLPLAFSDAPRKVLIVCFGMGTTHRSALSWGVDTTVVELTPSVPRLFPYYHADGNELLKSPHSHVIIDDGRRFLERSRETFDVITIDPPPPIGAAGSSLLYSVEFYQIAQRRLNPHGILQQWLPGGDAATRSAVIGALSQSFPYVRAFQGFGGFGIHFLASLQPLPERSSGELAARLPPNAAADLVEWGPRDTPQGQFDLILRHEIATPELMEMVLNENALRDDRPVNEYFLLRSLWR